MWQRQRQHHQIFQMEDTHPHIHNISSDSLKSILFRKTSSSLACSSFCTAPHASSCAFMYLHSKLDDAYRYRFFNIFILSCWLLTTRLRTAFLILFIHTIFCLTLTASSHSNSSILEFFLKHIDVHNNTLRRFIIHFITFKIDFF